MSFILKRNHNETDQEYNHRLAETRKEFHYYDVRGQNESDPHGFILKLNELLPPEWHVGYYTMPGPSMLRLYKTESPETFYIDVHVK